MKYYLPALLLLFAGCQTITIGFNPRPEAEAFLDALEQADMAKIKGLMTEDSAETLEGLRETIALIGDKESEAANTARKAIRDYKVQDCFIGSEEGFCKLDSGAELRLQKSGFSWKVDLKDSSFIPAFEEQMAGIFRSQLPPEQVAIRFTRSLMTGNVEEAKELSTPQSHMIVQLLSGMMSSAIAAQSAEERAEMEQKMKELDSMECDVEGDEALCGPAGNEKKLNLLRLDGAWKVDFKKPSQDSEKTEESEEPATMQAPPLSDSKESDR